MEFHLLLYIKGWYEKMGRFLENCTIYAVDFDGTLCESKYPGFGAPNNKLIQYLIDRRKMGDKVILWTNRTDSYLEDAVKWCNEKGLFFDAVNKNIPEIIEKFKPITPSPKVTADIFIDDLACNCGLPFGKSNHCHIDNCWNKTCPRKDKKD